MSSIFISHSSQDEDAARRLRERLEESGYAVFLDFDLLRGIAAGSEWESELYRHLRACRAVVVLCSPHSMASKWCFMEMTHARALGKPLFPVKIAECALDGVLTDRQVVDLTADSEGGLTRLENGLLAAGLDPADVFDWDPRRSPYPGLLAFQERDAAVFFGRDPEIGEGLELLNRARRLDDTRFVMVLGASGSGKSSLVRAGLVPRLKRDVERWLVLDPVRPGTAPTGELAARLSEAFERFGWPRAADQIEERLRRGMRTDREPAGRPATTEAPMPRDGGALGVALSAVEAALGATRPHARRSLGTWKPRASGSSPNSWLAWVSRSTRSPWSHPVSGSRWRNPTERSARSQTSTWRRRGVMTRGSARSASVWVCCAPMRASPRRAPT